MPKNPLQIILELFLVIIQSIIKTLTLIFQKLVELFWSLTFIAETGVIGMCTLGCSGLLSTVAHRWGPPVWSQKARNEAAARAITPQLGRRLLQAHAAWNKNVTIGTVSCCGEILVAEPARQRSIFAVFALSSSAVGHLDALNCVLCVDLTSFRPRR